MRLDDTSLLLLLFISSAIPCYAVPTVTGISPLAGSTQGATRLTIKGNGFSKDPFSFGAGNENKGNKVYLTNSTSAIECDVLAYWSNKVQIVCDTRAAAAGDYALLLYVDGTEISELNGRYCASDQIRCQFRYTWTRTPTIESVSNMYGTPGTQVKIRGRIYTDKFSTTETGASDQTNVDDPLEIQRIYWGNYICNLVDPDTNELYGIELDYATYGNIIVVPKGTYVESQQFTFLVSGDYGRCFITPESLRVSGQNKLYNYQTHAEITGVEPSTGSIAGGTLLTIQGNYFYELADLTVHVGGVPCDIKSVSDTAILCITKEAPRARSIYPGSRGILWERWFDDTSSLDAELSTNSANYTSLTIVDGASTLGSEGESVGRLRGYFVPPRDGDYRFRIHSEEQSKLFFSLNGTESDMELICETPSASDDWFTFPEQNSIKFPLLGGTPYYLEARYREGTVEVGVDMFDIPVAAGQLENVFNEKQEFSLASSVRPEIQTISAVGVYETQRVKIRYNGCNDADTIGLCSPTQVFYLAYAGSTTDGILVGSSAEVITSELSKLTSIPLAVSERRDVVVPDEVNGAPINTHLMYTYVVTYRTLQDLPLLTATTSDPNLVDITVTEVSSGHEVSGETKFVLHYGGQASAQNLTTDSTAEEVQRAFLDLFSVGCARISIATPYFLRDYEEPLIGQEWGERMVQPYCGRTSLLNPTYIFYAISMWKPGRIIVRSYRSDLYPKLCFAFRGTIDYWLNINMDYMDKKYKDQSDSAWYESAELAAYNGYVANWQHTCININTMVTEQGWIKNKVRRGMPLNIVSIAFEALSGDDKLYIDNLFIGNEDDMYQRVKLPALPNGVFVTDVAVTKIDTGFNISFTPADCGHNFPLIGLRDAITVFGSAEPGSGEVVYSSGQDPLGAHIAINRVQSAGEPIGGVFQLEQHGKYVTVSATASAQSMKESIESSLDSGTVLVNRQGACYAYTWDIEWTSKGGTQPLLQINETGLLGTDIYHDVERLAEGYLLMGPIPGEFLRTPHDEPQVEVMVNHIPSICAVNASCSFTYDTEHTPEVSSVSPMSGSEYESTSITISGSGFSVVASENNVTIGVAVCDVTSSSETTLTCDVGPGQMGDYLIEVTVADKGSAVYPNGNVTFQYNAGFTSVNPASGSVAGGTQISISGYGFSCNEDAVSKVAITVGSKVCKLIYVCFDEIICKIVLNSDDSGRRKRATAVDVVIIIDNMVVATGSGAFTYDELLTSSITLIAPTYSSVLGGGNLVISGAGFGSSGAVVSIGDAECEVISQSDSEVVCAISGNPPGSYDVELSIADSGFADTSSINQFEYRLLVTSVFPEMGSLHGDTLITIKGEGFGTDSAEVNVQFGNIDCDIVTLSDELIECMTRPAVPVKYVDNQGIHEDYGAGYKWNPQLADITVGDIMLWQWYIPTYVTGIGFTIQQTTGAESTAYDDTGFYCGLPSPRGSYAYKFTAPGIYYYSSGVVNREGNLYMKGIVRVAPKESFAEKLTVFVGDYEARHDTNIGVQVPNSLNSCSRITDPILECNTPLPTKPDSSSFYFSFWDCATPAITSISPNTGTPATVIGIQGFGFGEEACQNEILITGHKCIITSTSSTYIECVIDTDRTFPVSNMYHTVQLNVHDRGAAINRLMTPAGRSFSMVPSISGLSHYRGSAIGGTRLTIFGNGFSAATAADIDVMIGSASCIIVSFNYTQIICVTTKPLYILKYQLDLRVNDAIAVCEMETEDEISCPYTYDRFITPTITAVTPGVIAGLSTTIDILGSGFGNSTSDGLTVTAGGVECIVTYFQPDQIQCNIGYVPVGDAELVVNVHSLGDCYFVNESDAHMWSALEIGSATPNTGSAAGGQLIVITGNGFHVGNSLVRMSGGKCAITTMNISHIWCITPPYGGTRDIFVSSGYNFYPVIDYVYTSDQTPLVNSVTPVSGGSGDSITISGSYFSATATDITVTIDGVECTVTNSFLNSITCDVGVHSAGQYNVMVHVRGKGSAVSSTEFEYEVDITSTTPGQGSFGGGPNLEIIGSGFGDEESTTVTVCNNKCPILDITASRIVCDVPGNPGDGDTEDCDIVVTLTSGAVANHTKAWQYRRDMTPVIEFVSPPRGGTGGGTTLTVVGTGFSPSGNKVYIAGTECTLNSESMTEISCRTGAHTPSEKTKVRVEVGSNGIAKQDNASFYYVDVWSSRFTWGGLDPPIAGDFVIIPAGQTLLLDTDTPLLKMLLIQGGSFIFDEADITLNAEHILLMDGGLFQVGTEEEPFQHKATIVLHGHVRSKELPMYGAKTLAVRKGTLELHGKPIPVTWTHLAQSINIGDVTMTLMKAVTWNVGDQIVVATTGSRHSMKENEMLTITGISDDSQTLTFSPPVKYNHTGIEQTIGGVTFDTRAEVGLLTRNVVVRGSVNKDWTETIEACSADYNANQFAIQTCFQGRFGEETASDEFGAQIMLFAKSANKHWSTGRIEYVEVTHAGQAFRLGRYPIHFHLNGDVTGNYVRGCAIHHTFNRAVTIHAVHNLLVEHNVVYNIMGHAFFLEDGIETKNVIQYNLAVFVRPSSSLLNTDITPAAFWVTNPDNYVRHNNAAGGSHFGFWYNAPIFPGGPSFTTRVQPRSINLLEFRNNTCHSHGRYGLWVFPTYFPKSMPAEFYGLKAWNVEKGAEGVDLGNVRFIEFLISDAEVSAVEFHKVEGYWGGPMLKNSVIIGWSAINEAEKDKKCTMAGLQLPKTKYFTVDGVKFFNFDQGRCTAIIACAYCKADQGGFHTRFLNSEFANSPHKTRWSWQHEWWYEDLDGSLTGQSPSYSLLPYNPNLPPDRCTFGDPQFGTDTLPGAVCDETVKFHRMAFNKPVPSSLENKFAFFINRYGTSRGNFQKERLTHASGWMVTLVDGETYNIVFQNAEHITNISYTAQLDDFQSSDYVILGHNFTQVVDAASIAGGIKNSSDHALTYSGNYHGDWYMDNRARQMSYLISGKGLDGNYTTDLSMVFQVFRCYFNPCTAAIPLTVAPPTEQSSGLMYWSDPRTWKNARAGWGGNKGKGKYGVPVDGDNVMILPGTEVIADTDFPVMGKLFIYGTLKLEDTRDFNLTATYILIQGGRLIIGESEEEPFTHKVLILLVGNHFTPNIMLPNGPNLGSKALGAFGGLDLHGKNHIVYWTHLATTAYPGNDSIKVMADTDWEEDDEIVITTTSFETWHTETFKIQRVVDSKTFVLNGTFQNKHISEEYTVSKGNVSQTYSMRAEVGLLTRNIKIEGAHYEDIFKESFGARVIVGKLVERGKLYRGYGSFSNVEFFHTGQEGWTDFQDPRFSLVFLDTGLTSTRYPSKVKGCSFHNGFNTAIGLLKAYRVSVVDNVIHHVVGTGVIDTGVKNRWIRNLVALVIFPGTYQDRYEGSSLLYNAGIDIEKATDTILIDNTVAGSERVGFKVKGEECKRNSWRGNVAHGTLHGVHLFRTSVSFVCSKISGFTIYKSYDFGIYIQAYCSMIVSNVVLIDNKAGLAPLIIGPSVVDHKTSEQFVRFENSLVVGMSPGFDCRFDKIDPESSASSKKLRGPRAGHRRANIIAGNIGLVWPSFMSGPNLAPVFGFHWVMDYPSIAGITLVNNVIFSNFNMMCDANHIVIMTNPDSIDFMHPIHTQELHLVAVETKNKILYQRPDVTMVNPADCVDMDCDGKKKAMIRDLDGSLLGAVGTVIPDSAFEWNGDPRRGLGDYRIPKVMVTEPDGSRIPYEEKMPNKGIYRGHGNECTWNPAWTAYECHGIDYNVMVIESLDGDTEVRRLSPVGLYTDTYVDLINGPADHGWCQGYTCQERLSTFYSIVALSKEYELIFTGTNPQSLRFHLLNSEYSQKVVVGIWYANPQRLDVYVNGMYIMPNNGGYEDGEFVWKNDLTAEEYKPSSASTVYGENFFDRDLQILYILVHGPQPVDIRTTPVIMVTFGVPAITVDEFFEENLIQNLVGLLNVEASQIRIMDVIAEDSRRRRRAAGEVEVIIEIGDPPAESIETPEDTVVAANVTGTNFTESNVTEATPVATTNIPDNTTGHTHTEHSLSFDSLVSLQSTLANEMQTGSLADSLDIQITSMAMTDPEPVPVDTTGGVRASNETSGAENGTERFDEHIAHVTLESQDSDAESAVVYRIPAKLTMRGEPGDAMEDASFNRQPQINVFDVMGVLVEHLGTRINPWLLTASIHPGTGNNHTHLHGNTTQPFVHGWVNYTNLVVDATADEIALDFYITFPGSSSLAVSSVAFSVAQRPHYAIIVGSPHRETLVGKNLDVIVEVQDGITMQTAHYLAGKKYTWHAAASLYMPTNYRGKLVGETNTIFDLDNAQAHLDRLSINTIGYQYILEIHVWTIPSSSYDFVLLVDPFDVRSANAVEPNGTRSTLTCRFDADYDTVVAGKEDLLKINFMNTIGPMYPNVTMSNVNVTRGSILITFDLQGDVASMQEQMWEDISRGLMKLNFNGYILTADPYLMVDGRVYDPDYDDDDDDDEEDEDYDTPYIPEVIPSYESLLPIWIIAAVVVNGLMFIVILVWFCYKCECSKYDKPPVQRRPRIQRKVVGDAATRSTIGTPGTNKKMAGHKGFLKISDLSEDASPDGDKAKPVRITKPATNAKPSPTKAKPSPTNAKPSPTKAKPSATKDKPSATKDKSSATKAKPSATKTKPSPTKDKPSAIKDTPSATKDKPSATKDKPSPTKDKPSATKDKPVTKIEPASDDKPSAKAGTSATKAEHTVTKAELSTTNDKPSNKVEPSNKVQPSYKVEPFATMVEPVMKAKPTTKAEPSATKAELSATLAKTATEAEPSAIMTKLPGAVPKDTDQHQKKDKKLMCVMVKSNKGIFQKLIMSITVDTAMSLYNLRKTVNSALTGESKGKNFTLLMETLKEVDASQEKTLLVSDVYSSDCVLIKWVNDDAGTAKLCLCGREGHFHCSSCRKQAYCSPKCQNRDWPRHSSICSARLK